MDEKFKKLEDKIDKLADKFDTTNSKLSDMDKNLAVYNEQLKIHIEGTIQNREALRQYQDKMESEMKPIKSHVALMNSAAKIILFMLAVLSGVIGILKFFTT